VCHGEEGFIKVKYAFWGEAQNEQSVKRCFVVITGSANIYILIPQKLVRLMANRYKNHHKTTFINHLCKGFGVSPICCKFGAALKKAANKQTTFTVINVSTCCTIFLTTLLYCNITFNKLLFRLRLNTVSEKMDTNIPAYMCLPAGR
jgi:hypothetical protein